ncbi:MAG: cofactor-independent phosphoglycerate mutase [Eubacteriales bacterium]|nr:cofactor-independent phosphoglycerate mutase [Eubacteriales bacterium]MDD4583214.1 cofactor-independent phosphoglycerate mutase [Eubacteriales bacterium]
MKYLILVTDGAADEKIDSLGGKTPLEAADMENINALAAKGTVGMVKTIPDGMAPGSDVANLSVMGYDPKIYHTGRSPLEAASIGVSMSDTDVAFRCNIVTLKGEGPYENKIIIDHSAGDITTEEAQVLIQAINQSFGTYKIQFHPGFSYRHAMVIHDGEIHYDLTPPHDILDRRVGDYLPKGKGAEFIEKMMRDSYDLLACHPVNLDRVRRGLNPANSIWIWGQGRKPALTPFYDKYHVKGATISAVDLIKGIGICAGLETVNVPGATGTIDTNFEGKSEAAIEQFKNGLDFVYLHLEAPDECSHQGDLQGKIKSLEIIDRKIVGPVVSYLNQSDDAYKVLILPDHETPMHIRTHREKPVPFVLYDSSNQKEYNPGRVYGEDSGTTGLYFDQGYKLTDYFFKRS